MALGHIYTNNLPLALVPFATVSKTIFSRWWSNCSCVSALVSGSATLSAEATFCTRTSPFPTSSLIT